MNLCAIHAPAAHQSGIGANEPVAAVDVAQHMETLRLHDYGSLPSHRVAQHVHMLPFPLWFELRAGSIQYNTIIYTISIAEAKGSVRPLIGSVSDQC